MVEIGKRDFLKTAVGTPIAVRTLGLAAGAKQSGAKFEAFDFQGPVATNAGASVTAEVTIRNTGDAAGEVTVEYRISGQFVAQKQVALDPGEGRAVSLTGDVPSGLSSGETTQGIYLDGSGSPAASGTIIIDPSPADIRVDSITQFPVEGRRGNEVSITAQVSNVGDQSGTATFQYRIGGKVAGERTGVSLGPGETRTLSITGTVPDLAAGNYLQGVFVGTSAVGVTANFRLISDPASYAIETFSGPSRAQSGTTVTAQARVRNTGGSTGTETFQYRIDGSVVATREVTLTAGESRTLSFEGTVPDRSTATYRQGVFVGQTSLGRTASISVTEDPAAKFAVSSLRAPSSAEVGAAITVRATVTNTGRQRDQTLMAYRIGSTRLARQEVDLRPGESVSLTFDVTVPDVRLGTYQQGVFVDGTNRGQTTSLRVVERARVTVSGLSNVPSARVGSRVAVEATLRNRSNMAVDRTAEYRIGARVVARRDVRLSAGESRTFRFEGDVPEIAAGRYLHGVFVERESSTATINIKERPTASFTLLNFEGPEEAVVGQSISAQAAVRNTGEASGGTTVEYRIGERVLATRSFVLLPGTDRIVSFDATVPNLPPGDYEHGVFITGTTRGQTRQLSVTAGSARFNVSNLRSPASGRQGDAVTVEATVTNTGTAAGQTTIQYRFDGNVVGTQTVDLAIGESTTVTFNAAVPQRDAGTYSQGVFVASTDQGQTTSFVVEPEPTPTPTETPTPTATATDSPTPTDSPASGSGPGFGIVGALSALGGAGYLLKRRGGSEESSEE